MSFGSSPGPPPVPAPVAPTPAASAPPRQTDTASRVSNPFKAKRTRRRDDRILGSSDAYDGGLTRKYPLGKGFDQ